MKRFTSEKQQIGQLGESLACKYLIKQGFSILDRNYTKKIGEIDIVCQKNSVIHFVEVKTIVKRNNQVSRVTNAEKPNNLDNVSRETYNKEEIYNPFENITRYKLRKFSRTVEWYLVEKHVSRETSWVIDAVAVILDYETRRAKVEVLWNVIA